MKKYSLFPAAVLVTAIVLGSVADSRAQWGPCNSTATSAAGITFICPYGDGDLLGDAGLTITVTIRDDNDDPVPNIPPQDFWLIGCSDLILLCGGANSISAVGPTDANGTTLITGTIAGGGCDIGVRVVCQGIVLGNGPCAPICLPIEVRSPDQRSPTAAFPDLAITSADFAYFGASYGSPPKPYFPCHDFVGGPYGTINLADFAKFGAHWAHLCQ